MKKRSSRRTRAILLSSAAVGIASACAIVATTTASATPGSQFTKADGVVAEYNATVANFPLDLPVGVEFPREIPYSFGGENDLYEAGVGESVAYFYWRCAWVEAAVSNEAQRGVTQDALGALEAWDNTPFYRDHVSEPDGTWLETVVEPAADTGDISKLTVDYQVGCLGGEGGS